MRCENVHEWIPNYVAGKLTEKEAVMMDEHLDHCEACMKTVDEYLEVYGPSQAEEEELMRLMRVPIPSREQVQAGVNEVLRAIRRLKAETMVRSFTTPSQSREPIIASRSEQIRIPSKKFTMLWIYGLATVAAMVLVVFAWHSEARYRALEQQFVILSKTMETLKRQNEFLKRENTVLQREFDEYKRTQQLLKQKHGELEQKIAQLQRENEKLRAQLKQPKALSEVLVTIREKSGATEIKTDGTVLVKGKVPLPSHLAKLVRDFIVKGSVQPTKSTVIAMATLDSVRMESALRSAHAEESSKPVPLSPVLTAVRSVRPTLRWTGVPNAEGYVVRVADRSDRIVWEGDVGTQTQVTLPPGALKRGRVYFWQVEAFVEGQSLLSPIVGFWVIGEKDLSKVQAAERKYRSSVLVLASIYSAYGLYEEALAQIEQLKAMNPDNPFVKAMLQNLRRQWSWKNDDFGQ